MQRPKQNIRLQKLVRLSPNFQLQRDNYLVMQNSFLCLLLSSHFPADQQQQMALLDLQIDRAISIRDTLLLKGLEVALQQLLVNSDVVREEIRKQLESLERQMEQR